MNKLMMHRGFQIPGALLLSAVFLYSFYTKILDPEYFVTSVTFYRLFPLWPLNMASVYLIFLEAVLALALWHPGYRREAAALLAGLLLFFILIIAVSMLRGLDISCGCFGEESARVGVGKLLENSALLLLSAALYRGFGAGGEHK